MSSNGGPAFPTAPEQMWDGDREQQIGERPGKPGMHADGESAPCVHVRQPDANLIAAAPELLAQLRECRSIMDSLRDFVAEGGSRSMVGAIQAIREADHAMEVSGQVIARAEGRP